MKHRNKQGLFSLALLTALTLIPGHAAYATKAAPTQRQVIDRFITYSNFAPELDQLPLLVRKQLESDLPGNHLSSARQQELSSLLLDSFESDRARRAMTQQLSLGYDNRRFLALIQKLENPLIRKLRAMEQAVYGPVARHEMEHYVSQLPDHPVPPKREKLIRELISANGSVDNAVKTRTTLQIVVQQLMDNGIDQSRAGLSNTVEQSIRISESLRPTVENETLAKALYTYRDASDEEILQYIDFYNSAAGEWFKLTQQNGWLGALRNIGRDVAWKMQHTDENGLHTAAEDDLEL